MSNNNIIIGVVVVLVLIVGGFFLLRGNEATAPTETDDTDVSVEEEREPADNTSSTAAEEPQGSGIVTVVYTDEGFEPQTVTVRVGEDAVAFVNDSSRDFWPASAIHPTHTVYPGSGIHKCGTDEQFAIFDACEGIAPGDSWTFVFDEAGEWNYHDHLRPSAQGTFVVVE